MNARAELELDGDCMPPWSCEAEQSVLGGLMIDPGAQLRMADARLTADHFYSGQHRLIWAAISGLAASNQAIDVVTTFERLQSAGKAEEAGGLSYLNDLAQCVPSASNIRRYAEIVREKSLQRAVIAAADRALTIARQPGDAAEKLDQVATIFASVDRPTARGAPRQLAELMPGRLEHWQALDAGDATPGIPTGISNLDTALAGGLKPGKVIVLAARPSVGKTSFAQQIGLTVAAAGHTVLMLSQEMPAGELVDRVMANLGGVNLEHLSTGRFDSMDWAAISAAADTAARLPFFVDDHPALTLLDIRAKSRQVQQRSGLALLIVDYLQLCASTGSHDKRHHQIEQISRGLKQLAKELDICVLALSQLSRQSTRRSDGEPELDDLKESGAIEEDADTVILLHPMGNQSNGSLLTLAKVPKNRSGRRGRLALEFTGKTQRWVASSASVARKRDGAGGDL